jgi:hypothetical protein
MPDESRTEAVEKFLTEQKTLEDRRQALIEELLQEKEAAIKGFDERLAKLGYHSNSGKGKGKRNHDKKATAPGPEPPKATSKPKA